MRPEMANISGEAEDLFPKRESASVVWQYFIFKQENHLQEQVLHKQCCKRAQTGPKAESLASTTNPLVKH